MLSLPIDPLIPQILSALAQNDQVILTASPGAGKTTRLPPRLLESVKGKVAVLEPRRVAALGAAQRVAEEQNWKLGEDVGYQVRFESKVTAQTRLIFMTDALMLRRMIDDTELEDFDLVVIDEFHERNLNQDVILGILKELQELGRKIKILIMSATLDVQRLQKFLPESLHIDVPGKVFPLEIKHLNQSQKLSTDPEFYQRLSEAITQLDQQREGDILVFLPGVGEIKRLHDLLIDKKSSRDIFELHGSMSLNEQKQVLKVHSKPRIILTTNIAEASVTVPGVDTVVDSGLSKNMNFNFQSGFSRLELNRIAKFNADQRAGRAARQKEGLCLRMWSKHDEVTQDTEMIPECQRVDLSSTVLLLAHLGVSDFSNFAWFDPPAAALLSSSIKSLQSLGALDAQRRLTQLGKKLVLYPLSPRLSAIVATGVERGLGRLSAFIAALLQDRDIIAKKSEVHAGTECDLIYRIELLKEFEKNPSLRDVNQRQAQITLESIKQIESLIPSDERGSLEIQSLRSLLLKTQSDRLARRRKESGRLSQRALMVGGRGLKLEKESHVKDSEFFICHQGVDFPGQSETQVSLATGLSKSIVLETLKDQIEVVEDIYYDEEKGQFYSRRIRRFKDLVIDDPSLTPIQPEELGERFVEALLSRWDWIIENNEGLKHWVERWKFLLKSNSDLADLSEETLRQTLSYASYGKTKMSEVLSENLVQFLESALSQDIIQHLHKEAPARFTAASGAQHKIHYPQNEAPYVEVRLQEMFGVTSTPRLGFGNTPLTFRLLAPNFRPVQVTSDIASFWKNAYFEVRKELRSRYPKHSWPEDPLTATAEAKGRRR